MILIFCLSFLWAQETKDQTTLEKAMDAGFVDFKEVKEVLQKDGLKKEAEQRQQKVETKKTIRKIEQKQKIRFPVEEDFWEIMTMLWLVQNSDILKWDFKRPAYGVSEAFDDLLSWTGMFGIRYKILYVNGPSISHMAFPGKKNDVIFILSVPFMKAIDLSKTEITLLMLEDLLRINKGYFKETVSPKDLKEYFGVEYQKKPYSKQLIDQVMTNYSDFVFQKGFNFQQQFEVTKHMGEILKSRLNIWNAYFSVIKRIDGLVKSNTLYKDYNRLFPSPELQMQWLTPAKVER